MSRELWTLDTGGVLVLGLWGSAKRYPRFLSSTSPGAASRAADGGSPNVGSQVVAPFVLGLAVSSARPIPRSASTICLRARNRGDGGGRELLSLSPLPPPRLPRKADSVMKGHRARGKGGCPGRPVGRARTGPARSDEVVLTCTTPARADSRLPFPRGRAACILGLPLTFGLVTSCAGKHNAALSGRAARFWRGEFADDNDGIMFPGARRFVARGGFARARSWG